MPERGPSLRTERVAAASRLPATLAASLIVLLILVAVLKPWAVAQPAGATLQPGVTGVHPSRIGAAPGENAGATTGPDPTIDPLTLRKQCQDPRVWRLVTIERSGALLGRSLLPITLVAANGPTDPAIVPQVVRTGELVALGYCVPSAIHADVAVTEQSVAIWDSVGGHSLNRLSGARVLDTALASVGEVYLAPPGSSQPPSPDRSGPTWPEGRYVFEIPGDSPAGNPGWFAFSFASTAVAFDAP